VAAGLSGIVLPVWLGLAGVLLAGLAADFWQLRRASKPRVERSAPDSFALGVWTDVSVALTSRSPRDWTVELFDKPPSHAQLEGLPRREEMPAGKELELTYRMKATERGKHAFDQVDLRLSGPLGLLTRQFGVGPTEETFRVYPNFKAVARYALMAVADRIGEMGIRQVRRRGTGMEFSHLREYREGDQSRQIDWKATARHQKLISREYEDERNQHIVFMLDCGRRMRAKDDQLSHFDRCLNASLLLTHVALRQGDSVALTTFGGRDIWIPRQKGPRGMNTIMNRVYDLQPTTAPSDFSQAARRLSTHQRRRSLVILLTNLYDQLTDELLEAVELLRQRHVVLAASLRETVTEELTDHSIEGFDRALLTAGAHDYLAERKRTHQELTSRGVMLMDVMPQNLSIELVNRYIEIKREGML
jgi:uncharacterized protein (DUF58 family)